MLSFSISFSSYLQDIVLRLDIFKKLEKHRGCVNTVSFNVDGDILVSGSDDRRVILWDWESGRIKLSFHCGHTNNVFQAKIMPYTDDRSIVTCAADGQVSSMLSFSLISATRYLHRFRLKLKVGQYSPMQCLSLCYFKDIQRLVIN